MTDASSDETEQRIRDLEDQVARLSLQMRPSHVRKRSQTYVLGLPLWEVAMGPDLAAGERRGHAKAIIAIGDIATGFVAIGGVAIGGVAIGGLTLGLAALGGLAIGVLFAFGGGAIGLAAIGGGAIGFIAVGGAAAGYYALGDVAFGKYVVSTLHQDPEALRLFGNWIPGLEQMFPPK